MDKIENKKYRLENLKVGLEDVLKELDDLRGWDTTNAYQLSRLNERRHSFLDDIIDLEVMDYQSYAFGCDETNRDIGMGKFTTPKKNQYLYIHGYNSGLRNLKHEIQGYITAINSKLTQIE